MTYSGLPSSKAPTISIRQHDSKHTRSGRKIFARFGSATGPQSRSFASWHSTNFRGRVIWQALGNYKKHRLEILQDKRLPKHGQLGYKVLPCAFRNDGTPGTRRYALLFLVVSTRRRRYDKRKTTFVSKSQPVTARGFSSPPPGRTIIGYL